MGRLYGQCREHIISYTCTIKLGKTQDNWFPNCLMIFVFSKSRSFMRKEWAKSLKRDTVDQRKILIKLVSYSQKELLLRDYSHNFSNYEDKNENEIEKVHQYFCKRKLNVSKYASKNAVNAEMGRCPIMHKAWGLAVKYWLRLENGTENAILNEAFLEAKTANHDWIQSVQYMLCTKGFRDIWLNPLNCNEQTFHKMFIQRLDDQYRQNLLGFIKTSSRFQVLSSLKDGVELSPYITQIRNPDIRQIFTGLRIDLNCLVTWNKEDPHSERYMSFLSYWRRGCWTFFTCLHSFW